jgi:hypothetical protein
MVLRAKVAKLQVKKSLVCYRNISLGGGMITLPERNFARFQLMMYILLSLVIRTAWQSLQFEYMLKVSNLKNHNLSENYKTLSLQEMRPNSIETLDELVEHNFTIYCSILDKRDTSEMSFAGRFEKFIVLINFCKIYLISEQM